MVEFLNEFQGSSIQIDREFDSRGQINNFLQYPYVPLHRK